MLQELLISKERLAKILFRSMTTSNKRRSLKNYRMNLPFIKTNMAQALIQFRQKEKMQPPNLPIFVIIAKKQRNLFYPMTVQTLRVFMPNLLLTHHLIQSKSFF